MSGLRVASFVVLATLAAACGAAPQGTSQPNTAAQATSEGGEAQSTRQVSLEASPDPETGGLANDAVTRAEKLLRAGKPGAAEQMLRAILTTMPEGWKPIRGSGSLIEVAAWDMSEIPEVIASQPEVKTVRWVGPSYTKAMFLLAFALIDKSELDEARALLERARTFEPERPTLVRELAFVALTQHRADDALSLFDKGLQKRQALEANDEAGLLRGKGVALAELGRFEEAEAALRESLTRAPGNKNTRAELDYVQSVRAGKTKPLPLSTTKTR